MIRVVFAEDQMIVRRGIVSLLHTTDDIRVVAEAADGDEALAALTALRPDVALLDIRMPCRTGIEVLEVMTREGMTIPAILLTTFDEDPLFLKAVQCGAKGFLLKDVSVERLAAAIRIAAAGGTLLRPAVTERVVRAIQEKGTNFESAAIPDRLTPREIDVLRLIAGGYSNREVADALSMSEGSVKNHASSILSKLGARDRTRAVLRGIELGYI
ncbi:MAG TPA: response regulator transcription factor [Bryobacteraceae bacterium]|nr:response regulator transcription factor [Bryobacteraceae bacterium]